MIKYMKESISETSLPNRCWCAMMMSLFPWRLDCDSDDAREVEIILKEFVNDCVFQLSLYVDNSKINERVANPKWQKFIKTYVWNATEPLDVDFMKKTLEEVDSEYGCCNVH